MSLEQRLILEYKGGRKISIEQALLIASGVKEELELISYQSKLDILNEDFKRHKPHEGSPIQIAKALHDYLWSAKKKRYKKGKPFLTTAIDGQASPSQKVWVGNCLALTSLYTALGLRNNLQLTTLHTPNHILSRLHSGACIINIDNEKKTGFNINIKEKYQNAPESSLYSLVSATFHARGNQMLKEGSLKDASQDYEKALLFDGKNAYALEALGIIYYRQGQFEKAKEYFTKAYEEEAHTPFYEQFLPFYKMRIHKAKIKSDPKTATLGDYLQAYAVPGPILYLIDKLRQKEK